MKCTPFSKVFLFIYSYIVDSNFALQICIRICKASVTGAQQNLYKLMFLVDRER